MYNLLLRQLDQSQTQLIQPQPVQPQSQQISQPSSLSVYAYKPAVNEGESITVSWTPASGDFDYYMVGLGNKYSNNISYSINSYNPTIPKYQTSQTFIIPKGIVKEFMANNPNATKEQIQNSFYFYVTAEKSLSNGKSSLIAKGQSQTVVIREVSTSSQPSITILSPNGGETYYIDKNGYATLTVNISKVNTNSGVDLYLTSSDGFELYNIINDLRTNSWTFSIPTLYLQKDINYFKIKACLTSTNVKDYYICDLSDSYFKVVSQNLTPPIQPPITIKATDSDNSPDYSKGISYPITREKYPDLFIKGVGKGNYINSDVPCIIGLNDRVNCQISDPFTTFYDYCSSPTQLNEAFVTSDGKLSAIGVEPPSGYICKDGAFVSPSQSLIKVLSPNGGEVLYTGNVYKISWNSVNAPPDSFVGNISLYKGSQFLYGILPSSSRFGINDSVSWFIPQNHLTGDDFKIQVILYKGSYGNESVIAEDWSDAPFSISSPGLGVNQYLNQLANILTSMQEIIKSVR